MARKIKSEGFFIANGMPFKDRADFDANALSTKLAEDFLLDNPNKELKYIVPQGFICIDADELDEGNREKYPKTEYPLEPIEYMRSINAMYKITPYSYHTSNTNRLHTGFKVRPEHEELIGILKLNNSASKLYPGIDTRGYRKQGKDSIQGAVYLNSPGKKRGGRPTPLQLIAGLDTTCYAPLGALLPNKLRPILRSGMEGEKTSLKLAKDMKFGGIPQKYFLEYCAEQARLGRESHDNKKCITQGDAAYEPEVKRGEGFGTSFELYRFKDSFYVLEDDKFVMMEAGDIEQKLIKIPNKKGGNRSSIMETCFMLKTKSKAMVCSTDVLSFKNKEIKI